MRYFLAVAREENITRAAERLHISQPSLSKQLIELEHEIGKPLLIRGKRKIILTSEGVLLRKRADEIITLTEKTERELSADAQHIGGEVAIGGNPNAAVLNTVAAVKRKYPDISFRFYCSDATDVLERMEHGSLDFAELLEPIDSTKYEYISLGDTSRWGLLMPDNCPLAQKSTIEKSDLNGIQIILHNRTGLQQKIAHWAQVEIEQLNIAATYNVVNGNPAAFVKSGLGYMLTTDDLLPEKLDSGLCFRPLFPTLKNSHALVWKRYAVFSKAADAVLNEFRKNISRIASPI